jgi:hypothetical protein
MDMERMIQGWAYRKLAFGGPLAAFSRYLLGQAALS